MELSNVIAAYVPIRLQRGASLPPFYFEFYDADDVAFDLTEVKDVMLWVRDQAYNVVKKFSIGQGFDIVQHPITGRKTLLVMDEEYLLSVLPSGVYMYDMKFVLNDKVAQFPLRAPFIVQECITGD